MPIRSNLATLVASLLLTLACLIPMAQAAAPPAADPSPEVRPASSTQAVVITGYHGHNAPFLEAALLPRDVRIQPFKEWLDVQSYAGYGLVVIDGSLQFSHVQPYQYSREDLQHLGKYLQAGGTLLIMHQGLGVFNTEPGRQFLGNLAGQRPAGRDGPPALQRNHPWLAHLALEGSSLPSWLTAELGRGLPARVGTGILEPRPGLSILHHTPVGQGQFIYVGWDLFRFRPNTRAGITPEQERAFTEQVGILQAIAADLYPKLPDRLPARVFFNAPYALDPAYPMTPPPTTTGVFRSHPPQRPLPVASRREIGPGPQRFVDAVKGNDHDDGSIGHPWQSVQHAVNQLKPGDTLLLREGTYYEHITLTTSGLPEAPITIRAYPGEMVILDGSFREFQEQPADAWEPAPGGAAGEYRSTRTYRQIAWQRDVTNVMGRFADSMTPLHGYRFLADLQTDNPYWTIPSNVGQESAVYCGPGLWFNPQTARIHCRLAHTRMDVLGNENYRGETDPRKLPLLVAGETATLTIRNARHLRLQDLVIRGSKGATVFLSMAGDVVLDGLTLYGGRTCLEAQYTQSLRAIHCAFRGPAAPWSFRSHLKYRAIEAQLFSGSRWTPTGNNDFELAYCEFTDSVDGIFIGSVQDMRFHHNLVDNITDDAIFITALTTQAGQTLGGPILIYQNRLSRALTTISFGAGHGRQAHTDKGIHTGKGAWICRNVFDLRQQVLFNMPDAPGTAPAILYDARGQGDHGSPIWEPLFVYHNTILANGPAWRNYYLHGWAGHANSTIRVLLNNIVTQLHGAPGIAVQKDPIALFFDGNLHYSLAQPAMTDQAFQDLLQASVRRTLHELPHQLEAFPTPVVHPLAPLNDTQAIHPVRQLLAHMPPGQAIPLRGQRDRYGDPAFVRLDADAKLPMDCRIQSTSVAKDAGIALPAGWFDPIRPDDAGAVDIGALPVGHPGWRIGIGGRYHVASHPD